jgi:hypothetical protein
VVRTNSYKLMSSSSYPIGLELVYVLKVGLFYLSPDSVALFVAYKLSYSHSTKLSNLVQFESFSNPSLTG